MKHFTIDELCRSTVASRNGIDNTPGDWVKKNLTLLVDKVLDPLREWYGKPIKVNSGYRCPKLNEAVGGVSTSQHVKGEAADIDTGNISENRKLFEYIKDNLPHDQLIWECGGKWIHVSYKESYNRFQSFSL